MTLHLLLDLREHRVSRWPECLSAVGCGETGDSPANATASAQAIAPLRDVYGPGLRRAARHDPAIERRCERASEAVAEHWPIGLGVVVSERLPDSGSKPRSASEAPSTSVSADRHDDAAKMR